MEKQCVRLVKWLKLLVTRPFIKCIKIVWIWRFCTKLKKIEQHDHFLCKVLNERFHYEHKCIFTGRHVFLDVGIAALEWEKSKVNEIVNDKTTVFVENYFKENSFFKVK